MLLKWTGKWAHASEVDRKMVYASAVDRKVGYAFKTDKLKKVI